MIDKWGRRLFTTGAVKLLMIGLVHSLYLFQKHVPANDTESQLLSLMTNYKFRVLSSVRITADFLQGFSISFMLAALSFGALDLALSRERAGLLKRVALINTIWLATMTVVSLRYFFRRTDVVSCVHAADSCTGLAKAAHCGTRLAPLAD